MKRILIFVVFSFSTLFLIIPVHAAGQSQETPPAGLIPLIVGIGQSNMAGALPITTPTSILHNVKMMNVDTTITSPVTWHWVDMQEPSSVWKDHPGYYDSEHPEKFKRYGPSTAFMRKLMTLTGWTEAGFINCGVGGTPITAWMPGNAIPGYKANFSNCWARIQEARASNYYVAGIVFINGESDTNSVATANVYTEDFNILYKTLTNSSHLNNTHLPLAFVRLGSSKDVITNPQQPYNYFTSLQHPCWDSAHNPSCPNNIWDQQTQLYQQGPDGQGPVSYWRMASANDLVREREDGLHYIDTANYDKLGQKLANQLFAAMTTP